MEYLGIIRFEHSELIEIEFGLSKDILLKTAFQKKILNLVITEKIFDEKWRELIVEELTQTISAEIGEEDIRKAVLKWSAYPGKLDEEVRDFYQNLKMNHRLALLTIATSRNLKHLKKVLLS